MKIGNLYNSSGIKVGEVHNDSDSGGGYSPFLDFLRAFFVIAAVVMMFKDTVMSFLIAEWNKDKVLCLECYVPIVIAPLTAFIVTWVKTRQDRGFGLTWKRIFLFLFFTIATLLVMAVVCGIHQYGLLTNFVFGFKHFLGIYLRIYGVVLVVLVSMAVVYTAIGGMLPTIM